MRPELSAAIVAGVISLIGIISVFLVSKQQLYNQYTTHQRNEWLKDLRKYSDEFLYLLLCSGRKDDNRLVELRINIISRLNAENIFIEKADNKNEFDFKIYGEISKDFDKIDIIVLQEYFCNMFKVEWEKVKKESKGPIEKIISRTKGRRTK